MVEYHFYYTNKIIYLKRVLSILYNCIHGTKNRINQIKNIIDRKLNQSELSYLMLASGRCCLRFLFENLHKTIILPDYTCNVVEIAAQTSNIVYYHVDKEYRFNIDEIVSLVNEYPNSCVVLTSYLNRELDYPLLFSKILKASLESYIILDECQNGLNIGNIPRIDNRIFIVLSFNNKMTFGFLGGMIIAKDDAMQTLNTKCIKKPGIEGEFHAMYTFITGCIRELLYAISNRFFEPPRYEKSFCKSIYSVQPTYPYRISISAAYIGVKYWDESLECIRNNRDILLSIESIKEAVVDGFSNEAMPYLPVVISSKMYGIVPLKGIYGGLSHDSTQREGCLVLHNCMRLNCERLV